MAKVFIYANSQGPALQKFLLLMSGKSRAPEIQCVENYLAIKGQVDITSHRDFISRADYFIYQPVKNRGFLSTEQGEDNFTGLLPRNCRRISFPFIYNDGLWPCFHEQSQIKGAAAAIDGFLERGATTNDIRGLYDRGSLFFDLRKRVEASIESLRLQEKDCDVKFADFIAERHGKECLFLAQSHPSSICFYELARQVSRYVFGRWFRPAVGERDIKDRNMANLRGYYPIDRYCIDELKLPYYSGVEENAANFYKSSLVMHCRNWLEAREQAMPAA